MGVQVIIKKNVKNCFECPLAKIEKVFTSDSFEDVRKIYCNELEEVVHTYLDWYDEAKIPTHCPFQPEEVQQKKKIEYYSHGRTITVVKYVGEDKVVFMRGNEIIDTVPCDEFISEQEFIEIDYNWCKKNL